MDPGLNELLKWGVSNSSLTTTTNTTTDPTNPSSTTLRAPPSAALASLFNSGPSDADIMLSSMATILSPASPDSVPLADKLTAFDNLEQLIENLDNANNLGPLGLWPPLLGCLTHPEPSLRLMAAWCVGTAVQNNERSQERMLLESQKEAEGDGAGEKGEGEGEAEDRVERKEGAMATLVRLATTPEAEGEEGEVGVRRKALYALSSECRNYQPAMDVFVRELERQTGRQYGKVDAADMEAVDAIISGLREEAAAATKNNSEKA